MNKIDQPNKICAIDASTNNFAYSLFIDKKINEIGKINFEGNDIYEKINDAARKTKSYFDNILKPDAIIIEHTVFMNSPKTAADLALIQGALLGSASLSGINIIGKVSPITWQNYLGNKKITKEEQLLIRSKNPKKSNSWYKAYERQLRKERTVKLIEIIYDKIISDYDVADACGIGHWAINNWNKAIRIEE